MREFDLLGFADHLLVMAHETHRELVHGLEASAKLVEKTAKGEFGEYQPHVGRFNEWAALAPSTLEHHAAMGANDTPLLVTGTLRDSVKHAVSREHLEAAVGSADERMIWQEIGTERIPPRPVLGPAAVRNIEHIERLLGRAAARGMLYGSGLAHTLLD